MIAATIAGLLIAATALAIRVAVVYGIAAVHVDMARAAHHHDGSI